MMARSTRYDDRFYRRWMQAQDLARFSVRVLESDLMILSDRVLEREALDALLEVRAEIEGQIGEDPRFARSLEPVPVARSAPPAVRSMARASRAWGVGPMASVAGEVAQRVGRALLRHADNVIVENGGDVFVRMLRPVTFRLYAGEESAFSDRIGFRLDARDGLGVCTSSGVVGPSLSFGRADAVVAISRDAAVADAAATALANRVTCPADVDHVVGDVRERGGLEGIIACMGDRIGFWGDLELASVGSSGDGTRDEQTRHRRT